MAYPHDEQTEPESVFQSMRSVEVAMRDFLSALDRKSDNEGHLIRAWSRCSQAFGELREKELRCSAQPLEDQERFEDELERLQRLNAVVTAAVGRERDQLVERLERAMKAGKILSNFKSTDQTGATCDVAG